MSGSGAYTASATYPEREISRMAGIAISLPRSKAGRMVPLGVTSARRAPQMPDVPTVAESGVPGYDAAVWFGILAPKGTSSAVIARLHDEIVKVIRQPDVENALQAACYFVAASRPDEFGAFLRDDIAKWGKVVREAKIQPE